MHSDRIECVYCGLEVLAVAKVHDECALLLIRPTTSPCRLVLISICCNMLKSYSTFWVSCPDRIFAIAIGNRFIAVV